MRATHTRRIRAGNLLLLAPAALCVWVFGKLDFLWLEAPVFLGLLVFTAIAGRRLNWSARPPVFCERLRHVARDARYACLLPAILSVAMRLALLPWMPIPHPVVPDEFSHTLLAKTLLLGRLANPAHPLWQHFESIHILSQPTYSSMYMAGQACFLAAGQLLFGNLFWGVLLSTALFCAALTWFLRAYVPPGWALFGGILCAVRIGAASYWNNSYWGGSAGALGGAMVLGAYPRLVKTWKPLPAAVFAVGLVLLANTRPYEGAILGGVLVAALMIEAWNKHGWASGSSAAALAVAVVILSVSGWAMTRHWKAVTGHALTLPYQVNQKTYGWPLTLPWIPVRPVTYRHPEFSLYRDFEIGEHRKITELAEMPIGLLLKYADNWRFFVGITMSAAFLFTGRIVMRRRTRVLWIAGAAVSLAVVTEQSGYPHYWSPIAPVFFLFLVEGTRCLAQCQWKKIPFGPAIVRSAIPIFCVILVARAATLSPQTPPSTAPNFLSWCCTDARVKDREPLIRQLQSLPGKHLVIVAYDLKTYDTFEWVYNEPDIDRARIVFARDMGQEKNRELFDYYPDRQIWRAVVVKDHATALERLR